MGAYFKQRIAELRGSAPAKAPAAMASAHPAYNCWKKMRDRCRNPASDHYRYYGARGITICARWDSFTLFIVDMGPRPTPHHTIDRIDNDGHYEPGNCRWATMAQQNANRRPR